MIWQHLLVLAALVYNYIQLNCVDPVCVNGVLTEAALSRIALIRSHSGEQRLFPGFAFTFNTTVTKWMVGAQKRQLANGKQLRHPQLHIWRRQEPQSDNYNEVDYRNITASELVPTGNSNVYEYSPEPPLAPLQVGDVLGLYQPEKENSEIIIFYQVDGGLNYKTFLGTEADNDLPLVSILETASGTDMDRAV